MTEFATETIVMLCLGALIVALLHIALTKIRKDLPQQSVSFDQKTFFGKNPWIWVFMAISALLCVVGLLFAVEPANEADPGQTIVLVLLILAFCLGTGCVEEGVFRGLLFAFPSVLLKKKFANKQYPP
ncbi:MAG: hypothetical protein J6Y65_04285, partial [Eggerthellaceae bacterium]|nr:hypothetical protein [Eggerthellaceae bacterium]